MGAISISGGPKDDKATFISTTLPLGTETIATVVPAGDIAIVIDDAVVLTSSNVETLIERLRHALRERVLKLA
jgi:hypothetical protein